MELEMIEYTDGNKNRSKNIFGDPYKIKIHIETLIKEMKKYSLWRKCFPLCK